MIHCRFEYSDWPVTDASCGRQLRLHSVGICLCTFVLLTSCFVYRNAHDDNVLSNTKHALLNSIISAMRLTCSAGRLGQGTRARDGCYHVKQTLSDFAIPTWRGVGPSRRKRSRTPLSATQLVLVLSPSWLTSTNISAAFSLHSMTVIHSFGFADCLPHGLQGHQLHWELL